MKDRYPIEEKTKTVYCVGKAEFYYREDAEREVERLAARPLWADYAAETFPEFMPLFTGEQVCEELGWGNPDAPTCCGKSLDVHSFLGAATYAQCKVCGKKAQDLTGPVFDDACARFLDTDKFQIFHGDPCWVIVSRGEA